MSEPADAGPPGPGPGPAPAAAPGAEQWAEGGWLWSEDLVRVLDELGESQERVLAVQQKLQEDFERLAASVLPLITDQYADTLRRVRVLETRLRNRQERPLVVQMASLLSDVRRLDSGSDVKAHVEEVLSQALGGLGYQEFGSPGDQFDPAWHEPLAGSLGRGGVVTRVHRRGLACYGDVILKAKVEVAPASPAEEGPAVDPAPAAAAPGREAAAEPAATPPRPERSEQEELSA